MHHGWILHHAVYLELGFRHLRGGQGVAGRRTHLSNDLLFLEVGGTVVRIEEPPIATGGGAGCGGQGTRETLAAQVAPATTIGGRAESTGRQLETEFEAFHVLNVTVLFLVNQPGVLSLVEESAGVRGVDSVQVPLDLFIGQVLFLELFYLLLDETFVAQVGTGVDEFGLGTIRIVIRVQAIDIGEHLGRGDASRDQRSGGHVRSVIFLDQHPFGVVVAGLEREALCLDEVVVQSGVVNGLATLLLTLLLVLGQRHREQQ